MDVSEIHSKDRATKNKTSLYIELRDVDSVPSPTSFPLANGFYWLAQYDIDGKVHYSAILNLVVTPNDFTLWPNPAGDKVVVNIQSVNTAMVQLKIFDSKGTLVRSKSLMLLPGLTQFEVDITGLASGVYLIEVKNTSGTLKKNKVFPKK